MKPGKLYADGHELQIEKRIGKGGEGEVFSLSNLPGFAVKTYYPELIQEREKKIHAMVASRLAETASMVAFPTRVVVDGRGAFAGFMMRLVQQHQEIHELQTPASRQKHFPKADYRFIVRVALNIARVFAQVHATGCVIGDINQRGILVSPQATVAIIDADSFQLTDGARQYLCVVGVPEYTPPELQGKSLKSQIRTPNHDAFGLAVCLFQLLCMDRHPFSGRYTGQGEMPLEKAIAEYRFAYSARNTGMISPPGSVCLADFTPGVARLFEAAFAPDQTQRRPQAAAWVAALEELETSLRVCGRNKLHHYARNAAECPWCRMESVYGRPLFIDADLSAIAVPRGRLDPENGLIIDLQALLAAVNRVAIPSSNAVILPQSSEVPKPSPAAKRARSQRWLKPVRKIAGLAVAAGAACGFYVGMRGVGALVIAALGLWLFFKKTAGNALFVDNHQRVSAAIAARLEALQRSAPFEPVLRKKAAILDALEEYKQLVAAFGTVRSDYDKLRKQKQLDEHLARFFLRAAHLSKINSTDLASLASYGFTTAFDAKRRDVQQVHGIGPIKAACINAWIRGLEGKFRFRSAYIPEEEYSVQKAKNEIIVRQQGQQERLDTLMNEFRAVSLQLERWKGFRDPELVKLGEQLAQTEADLRHMNIAVPPRPAVAPLPTPAVCTFQRKAATGGAAGRVSASSAPVSVPSRWQTSAQAARTFPPQTPAGAPSGKPTNAQAARTFPPQTPAGASSGKPASAQGGRASSPPTTAGAPPGQTTPQGVTCPYCHRRMVIRVARNGPNPGSTFWGCSNFPACRGTRSI